MLAGVKGSEGLEEPGMRVTKPGQTQPITFFSWLSKGLTHREARPLRAELVKGRDGAGGVVLGSQGTSTCPSSRELAGVGSGGDWSFSTILFPEHI